MKGLNLVLMIAVVFLGSALNAPSAAGVVQKNQGGSQKAATLQEKQPTSEPGLDGGAVFQRYCGQCHGERYPTERIKDKWTIIATHMRVRGQLTGKEANAVLSYLQNNARQKRQASKPPELEQQKKQAPQPVTSAREETQK